MYQLPDGPRTTLTKPARIRKVADSDGYMELIGTLLCAGRILAGRWQS